MKGPRTEELRKRKYLKERMSRDPDVNAHPNVPQSKHSLPCTMYRAFGGSEGKSISYSHSFFGHRQLPRTSPQHVTGTCHSTVPLRRRRYDKHWTARQTAN